MNKSSKTLLVVLLVLATVLAIFGCSKDCAVCPKPESDKSYDGRLYVTMAFGMTGLFVIDTQTDSVIDSILYPSSALGVDVTPDGKFLAVSDDRVTTRIYDAKTLQVLNTLEGFGRFLFIRNGSELLGIRGGWLSTYSTPSFVAIYSRSLGFNTGLFDYNSRLDRIFTIIRQGQSVNGRWADTLIAIEPDSLTVVKKWYVSHSRAEACLLWNFILSSDGSTLFAISDCESGIYFLAYSLTQDSLFSSSKMFGDAGDIKISPKGDEVYVTDPGNPGDRFNPGAIYVFDANTGGFKCSISLVGYLPTSPLQPLDAWDVAFSPDGNDLFVATGEIMTRGGTVLRFSTNTKELRKVIFPNIDRFPRDMVVGPKP